MKINLHGGLVENVLSLTEEYSYTPGEIISIGIAMAISTLSASCVPVSGCR
jgi:hypothetical protein